MGNFRAGGFQVPADRDMSYLGPGPEGASGVDMAEHVAEKEKKVSGSTGNGALADSIFAVISARGVPLSTRELHTAMVARGEIIYAEVARVDTALAEDPRFKRWGRSNYFVLSEWQDFQEGQQPYGGALFEFIRARVTQIIEQAPGPVHYEKITERLNREDTLDLPASRVKEALDLAPAPIQGKEGMYWIGRKNRFRTFTVADAVRKAVSGSSALLTLDEIVKHVERTLPGRDIKRNTVSGSLRLTEYVRRFGVYWCLREWDEDEVNKRFEKAGVRGRKHTISAAELKNGRLKITSDISPFMPQGEASIFIRPSRRGLPESVKYNPEGGYISGMSGFYREKGIGADETVKIVLQNPDEHVYIIERSRESVSRSRSRLGRAELRFWYKWFNTFSSPATGRTIEEVLGEGTVPGETLVLVAPFLMADAIANSVTHESRVVVLAQCGLDRLLASVIECPPPAAQFKSASEEVLEDVAPLIAELYKVDVTCPKCGKQLVADSVSFVSLTANQACFHCTSEWRRQRNERKLAPAELDRLTRHDDKRFTEWHPEGIGDGKRLEDYFSLAYIKALSVIWAKIEAIEDGAVRSALMWCFMETLGERDERVGAAVYREVNPLFEFRYVLGTFHSLLQDLEGEDFYFLKPGNLTEVMEGKATYTSVAELKEIPDKAVEIAVVMLPYNGLKPLTDSERVHAAWLGDTGGDLLPPQVSDLRGYFKELKRVLKPGSRLNLCIESKVGAYRTFTTVDPILKKMGFEFAREIPEAGPADLEERERAFMREPEVFVYRKVERGR